MLVLHDLDKNEKAVPGIEPGFWEHVIRIPSDNRYTTRPYSAMGSLDCTFRISILHNKQLGLSMGTASRRVLMLYVGRLDSRSETEWSQNVARSPATAKIVLVHWAA